MSQLDRHEAEAMQHVLFEQYAELKRLSAQQGAGSAPAKRPRDPDGADVDTKPRLVLHPPLASTPPPPRVHVEGWHAVARALAFSGQVPPLLSRALFRLAAGESALDAAAPGVDQIPSAVPWPAGSLERFEKGRIFHTRTPVRKASGAPNCIELHELLRPESIRGLWMNTFLPEVDLFGPLLPIDGFEGGPHRWRNVPIHVSGDIHTDRLRDVACARAGIANKARYNQKDHAVVSAELATLWKLVAGPNWNAVYPFGARCVHSKAFVIKYPEWLLVVITSANAMRGDMELSDNHWFVQSFKKLSRSERGHLSTDFEQRLFAHMADLGCPESYLADLRGKYNFGATVDRVHLVPSTPRVKNMPACDDFSVFRLNSLAQQIIPEAERHDVELEFCCGSVGPLHEAQVWVKRVDRLLRGRNPQRAVEGDVDGWELPKWRVVFPTRETVHACDDDVRSVASNIGCCIRTSAFPSAPVDIRSMFHDYQSKDYSSLFHEKMILWRRPSSSTSPSPSPTPYMIYLGSHNLSKAALGDPVLAPARGTKPASRKLTAQNFELGVVVRGEDLVSMLEPGPGASWEDVLTYVTPARPYRSGEVPWNSPAWVANEE
ncbi:hypothetical protein JCM3775_005517 [Rhodotorula graminis]|uniref:PLD phosphodiesterase domain-containing protein n=1 Tax=Rhodotorula graminis (strain WP1) TaxID=578459 RepID=A0A0P9ITW2_RHOGW|nr:uncharacterized protein RHOBADRAFT_55535 [Rhodotorula graminis WP1]KPV72863.1 hypothetical protein RHOBADRAFT_55535 [Rhodotorula graminis WP1]